jgi:hypothetical protein
LVNRRVGEEIMSRIGSWRLLRRLHARIFMAREGRSMRLVVRVVCVREKEQGRGVFSFSELSVKWEMNEGLVLDFALSS